MYSFLDILHFLLIIQPISFALQLLTTKNISSISYKILGVLMIVISIFYFINADFLLETFPILKYKFFVVYGLLKQTMGIRMTDEEQFDGADLSIHKISSTADS